MMKLVVDKKQCSGCRVCEAVCSSRRMNFEGFNRKRACIRVLFAGELEDDIRPVVCRQCKKPLCASNCPTSSLYCKGGVVVLNRETCIGCGQCAEDCPFGAMVLHPQAMEPLKCDLCAGEAEGPLCARFCVTGALRCVEETSIGIK